MASIQALFIFTLQRHKALIQHRSMRAAQRLIAQLQCALVHRSDRMNLWLGARWVPSPHRPDWFFCVKDDGCQVFCAEWVRAPRYTPQLMWVIYLCTFCWVVNIYQRTKPISPRLAHRKEKNGVVNILSSVSSRNNQSTSFCRHLLTHSYERNK